jgi:hypothetical protein
VKVDDKLLIPIQLSKEDDERYRSLKQFEQVKKKSLKNSYKSDFIEVGGQVDVIFGKPSSKTYEAEKMRNIVGEEGYTPAKLISADYGVDVIFGNEKPEVNEAATTSKEGKEENKKTTDGGSTKQEYPISFEYRMFVRVMQKYNLKVWNDLFYIYSDMSGAYEPVREKILNAMIRNGWDEKTVSKLTRNVMADIIERISTEPSIQVDDKYFNSKGYIWDDEKQNYFLQPQEIEDIEEIAPTRKIMSEQNLSNSLDKYSMLLKILDENKEQLFELLQGDNSISSLPRYIIAGVTITKTIGMNNSVDRIVKDFCGEMNLTQKDFFEIAAIELLKKNGYADIVKANLKV